MVQFLAVDKRIDLYSHLAFKPGTRNLAFFTYDEKIGSYLQVGKDKTKISWNTRGGVRFSPDGSKLAYAAWDKNAQFVVVNGKKGLTYEYVGIPSFSRDSSTVAYVAVKRGREFLVYGRKRGKSYPTRLAKGFRPLAIMGTQPKGIRITEFDLSADGQKAAFAVREPDTGKAAVITNGKRSKEGFGQIWKIAMSPSGESGAFIALTGKADKTRMHVVVNDEEFGPYHWVPTLLANPVSDEFAFTVEDPGPKYLLRVGDQETSAFGKVYSPEYGADGRTFSFGMRKGPEMYWVTLTRGE